MTDVDGRRMLDLSMGFGAMLAGHLNPIVTEEIRNSLDEGMLFVMPSPISRDAAERICKRFNIDQVRFANSGTEAVMYAIRTARAYTGKDAIVKVEGGYHGSSESVTVSTKPALDVAGPAYAPNAVASKGTTPGKVHVVPFNDLGALKHVFELYSDEIACFIVEPVLENLGIVLPDDGYLGGVGQLAKKYGAVWIIDETHTISVGPGGMTKQLNLQPDFLTIGKAIGGGLPVGTFGMSEKISGEIAKKVEREVIDTGGIGGTLAGNALSLAAMRATLNEVLTEAAFEKMIPLGNLWCDGVDQAIKKYELPWYCSRLGARGEYLFRASAPKTGKEAMLASDFELEQYIHLRLLNDGFLLTPFHNMALISPQTTEADVLAHTKAFDVMCAELVS